ncbi:hypothetical protein P154DRAFT_422900 [Amniculicola lignicola CBS 123094]|uniref:Transcription factor domain-containing protein n=1 Tax=Amniculicola lignicola CBS 123094 TaxID=1392246 RepID=A0A6A5WZI6_9PLEO|nr:hypothetical protein P154DRAFT_422900 [Amniculicola lignicola CBS 123094]
MVPLNAAAKRVTDHRECDAQEEVTMRMLIAKLARLTVIGDGVDPFDVLPQYSSPELNSILLVRACNRSFVTQSTLTKWVPAMLSSSHLLLSAALLPSTYLDMHAGCSGDSKRTVLVKSESIGFINERLSDHKTQFEDATLMVILHLLAGEMWSCNEKTIRIHQTGIARLISARGGMSSLGAGGVMAEVAAGCSYHSDVVCEAASLPLFASWEPTRVAPYDCNTAVPESPLFCPRSDFFTIPQDHRCTPIIFELLCDMRELTDLFVAYHKTLNTVQDLETVENEPVPWPSAADYDAKVSEIQARLSALPTASTPGFPTTNDWVYESCRIAAIIYASAIIMCVPFSVAAENGRAPFPVELPLPTKPNHLDSPRLTQLLYETLERTDTTDIWGDMSGVLYWVAMVGAAAARTPTSINMLPVPGSRRDAYSTWIRRCLIMHSTRVMIILIFQYPLPIIAAQKRMLKVQELIGSGKSRRLVS